MLRALGLDADQWQADLLRKRFKRALLNCCRQSGKSTTTAALALHRALYPPTGKPALILILSPSLRQSGELFRKVMGFYRRLDKLEPSVSENAAARRGSAPGAVGVQGWVRRSGVGAALVRQGRMKNGDVRIAKPHRLLRCGTG
jgi:hypothetical protein